MSRKKVVDTNLNTQGETGRGCSASLVLGWLYRVLFIIPYVPLIVSQYVVIEGKERTYHLDSEGRGKWGTMSEILSGNTSFALSWLLLSLPSPHPHSLDMLARLGTAFSSGTPY